MRAPIKLLALFLALLAACTASWSSFVRYSAIPAPAGEDLVVGAYASILQDFWGKHRPTSAVVGGSDSSRMSLAAFVSGGQPPIPSYWPDSLKQQVAILLGAPALNRPADSQLIAAAATDLGVQVLRPPPTGTQDSTRPVTHIAFSGVSFNADSTLAAVRFTYWCGPVCAAGQTAFLARHPGFHWRVWHIYTAWIS
jgi:hypothetical protein